MLEHKRQITIRLAIGPVIGRTLLAAALVVVAGCVRPNEVREPPNPGQTDQPYTGWQDRPIKALAPERQADLLAGRGAGYALAAELNHYPGPTHVLELATALRLTTAQEEAVRQVRDDMQVRAQALGQQLVAREAALDRAFASYAVDAATLADLTGAIAKLEGELRATHLAAHLKTRAILTNEQVVAYDQLRGYVSIEDDRDASNFGPGTQPADGAHHGH